MKSFLSGLGIIIFFSALSSCGRYAECHNPVIYSDIVDNHVVRVDDSFYMFSSSDKVTNGIPYLKSDDLVHWSVAGRIQTNSSSLREKCLSSLVLGHSVYVFYFSNDLRKNELYISDDIRYGNWRRMELESEIIDGCLYCENGKWYCLFLQNDSIFLAGLDEDYHIDMADTRMINSSESISSQVMNPEMYRIGDWYYILLTERNQDGFVKQLCLRSKTMDGVFMPQTILEGDFHKKQNGIAGACLVQTSKGDWYAMLKRRYASLPQAPILQPVAWIDDWPIIGNGTTPIRSFKVHLKPSESDGIFSDDYFAPHSLNNNWLVQEHDDSIVRWSLTEHDGWLRIYSNNKSDNILDSETLFFRHVFGPLGRVSANIITDAMEPGQCAGAAAIWDNRSLMMAVCMKDDRTRHFVYQEYVDGKLNKVFEDRTPIKFSTVTVGLNFYLAYNCVQGCYSYRQDGGWLMCYYKPEVNSEENALSGVQFALFSYTTGMTGGYVDFDNVSFTPLDRIY